MKALFVAGSASLGAVFVAPLFTSDLPPASYAFAALLFACGVALGSWRVLATRALPTAGRAALVAVTSSLLAASLVMGTSGVSLEPAPRIEWSENEDAAAAIARAKAQGRPVLLQFSARWCFPCVELHEATRGNDAVRWEATRFTAVHVDATNDEDPRVAELQRAYRVVGLPELVLLDGRGNEVRRFHEELSPAELLEAMKLVR